MPIGSVSDIIKNDTFKTYRDRVNEVIALINTVQKQSGEQPVAPTLNDDASEGYDQGSFWLHYDNPKYDLYVCVDNTIGASVWDLVFSTDKSTYRTNIGATSTADVNALLAPINTRIDEVDSLISTQEITFVDVDSSLESNFTGSGFSKGGSLNLKSTAYHNKEVVLEFANPMDGAEEVYRINTFLEPANNVPDGTYYKIRLRKETNDSYDIRKNVSIVPNSDDLNAGIVGIDYTYYGVDGIISNPEFGRIQLIYDNAYVMLVAKNGLWHVVEWNRATLGMRLKVSSSPGQLTII